MRVPDGPGEAPAGLLGGCKMLKIHWFFYHVFTFSMHFVVLGGAFFCQPVLFEVGLGATRVPRWFRMALVRLQLGCLEGAT